LATDGGARLGFSEIRRNQHALRAASPRTPTPVLLALLRACSFRLEGEAVAWRFPLGAWLGRSATSCGPLVPRLRNRSVFRRQLPTEATPPARRSAARPKDSIDASAPNDGSNRRGRSRVFGA